MNKFLNVKSQIVMSKKGVKGIYCISKTLDDNNNDIYYVHKKDFSYMPVFGSFKSTLTEAKVILAMHCGVTLNELKTLKNK